jgi:DNA-binding transcriptional MerR regulator
MPAHGAGKMVLKSSGLRCRTTPEPLDACPEEAQVTAGKPANAPDRFDDDDYPAYTMGRAAEMIGVKPAFLRALGEARLITPLRSEGGHRRYSRYQLRIAARARELVDTGTPIDAACRIVILEDQLDEALRLNEELRRSTTHAGRIQDA